MIASSVSSGLTRAESARAELGRTDLTLTWSRTIWPRTVRRWSTYNLFRRRAEPDLVCAVPNDFPVPAFITGQAWTFAGSIAAPSEAPPGFSAEIAERGAETRGFHLFHQLPVAVAPEQVWRAAG